MGELLKSDRAYKEIKKGLKENEIRFQTPLARIRIHWNSGTRIYESAREAALDLRGTWDRSGNSEDDVRHEHGGTHTVGVSMATCGF